VGVFEQLDAWVTSLALAAAMLLAWQLGRWRGQKLRTREGSSMPESFDEAAMGVVALLIALTFAMSLGKHDERRQVVIAESNAISDFYTCATLLDPPVREKLQSVILAYAKLRLAAARHNEFELSASLVRFDQMQNSMIDLVAEAIRGGTPIAVPLTNTLNALTGSQTSHLAAVRDHLPGGIVLLLFLAAVISVALLGRRQGFDRTQHVGILSYILLVTLVVFITLDLNQTSRGLITVSQEPLERLIASMEQ
jgi:hypothetical protein